MKTKMSGGYFKPCPEISGRAIGVGVTPLCARSVKSKFLSVLSLALACAAGPLASSGAAAGVTILNGVNPGSSTAQARALNTAGVVVGESTTSNPGRARFAATWTDGALSMLPGLPGAPAVGDGPLGSTQGDAAFGINKHGVSVGLAQWPVPGGNFNARAVRWTHGVPTELAALPGSTLSGAQSINNDGEMAGFSGDGIDFQAVRWSSAGAIQTLDLLPTHTTSYASDINASGRVVGYSGLESDGTVEERLPVFWDGTRVSTLPLPPGFNQGQAVGLDKNDIIVGQAAAYDASIGGNTGVRAVLWAEHRFQPDLLALLPGSSASTAVKVNKSAWIIGACYPDADSATFGFGGTPTLWYKGVAIDLTSLLESSFPSGTRFTLADINASGAICGNAVGAGSSQGFVLSARSVLRKIQSVRRELRNDRDE